MRFAAAALSLGLAILASGAHAEPVGSFGYDSVAEALLAVRADPNAQVQKRQGWMLATQEKEGQTTFWAFTPPSHPAHPAVVKRTPVRKNQGWYIEMAVLCGPSKLHCDRLVDEFHALNEKMRQDLEGQTRADQ